MSLASSGSGEDTLSGGGEKVVLEDRLRGEKVIEGAAWKLPGPSKGNSGGSAFGAAAGVLDRVCHSGGGGKSEAVGIIAG